jgi:hypothetical protein
MNALRSWSRRVPAPEAILLGIGLAVAVFALATKYSAACLLDFG